MLIFMLAAAMTIAMLIATFLGLQEEAAQRRLEEKRVDRFGFRH
jgi:hypothetical protein